MNSLLVSKLFSVRACIIYAVTLFVGMLYSLVVPTLSVFLGKEIGVRPFLIGIFFVSIALMGIVYSQTIALWSEKMLDRRKLVLGGMVFGALACFGFGYFRVFSFVLILGVTCFSLSFVSASQVLALAREYGEHEFPTNTRFFNSVLRAFSALAWAVGPPLGFTVLSAYGFQKFYMLIGALFLLVGAVTYLVFPKPNGREPDVESVPDLRGVDVVLTVCIFSMLFAVNHGYLISLPLFIDECLNLRFEAAGWLLGVAAAIQIPIMIIAGWLSRRVGITFLVTIGAIAGLVFNAGFLFAQALWQLFTLQIFYAMFMGLVSGLGISVFQEILPKKAGTAPALFFNCISAGSIVGSLVVAIVADTYSFREVFTVNVGIIFIALLFLAVLPKARAC